MDVSNQKPVTTKSSFRLIDITAIIVGYALASLLVRAFWPSTDDVGFGVGLAIFILYAWLGMAMSGPIVLLTSRKEKSKDPDALPTNRTWAELAWLVIGFYWIALTMLVVPIRTPTHRLRDSAILGLFPILAALVIRLLGPTVTGIPIGEPTWTHRAGLGLLIAWPFAWLALILLGKTLL